jgi:hypothetical protein
MRKFLLSTSALAGAALLSSAAIADVSISGSFEFDYAANDSNLSGNDGNVMGHDQEVNIAFTNKTDSGLTIAAQNQFKTSSGAQDDVSVSISGGFGKITLGKTDGVNANYEMDALALTAEESAGTLDDGSDANTATISTSTGGGGGNNNQVSYHLPAMGGLTAGISVGTGTIVKNNEFTAFGMNYALEAGGAAVTLGYSTKTTETTGTADNDLTSMGVKIVMNGVSVMATNGTYEAVGEDRSTNSAGISYTLANGLTVGYVTVKSEDDATTDVGEEYTANHYEASYAVASGLTAVLNVSDFDYENGTGTANTSMVDQNGTITSLTIKASF